MIEPQADTKMGRVKRVVSHLSPLALPGGLLFFGCNAMPIYRLLRIEAAIMPPLPFSCRLGDTLAGGTKRRQNDFRPTTRLA